MFNLNDLKTRVYQLQEHLPDAGQLQLRDKILYEYHRKTLNGLQKLFDETSDAQFLPQLEAFLKENWELVKGSALCYTAIPDNEMTKFLCKVGGYVVQERNKQLKSGEKPLGIVNVLMPTVRTDSSDEQYPALGPELQSNYVNKKLVEEWMDVPLNIDNVLKTHILSEKGEALLPVRLVTDFELNAETPKLANPYFDYHDAAENAFLNKAEMERLIGHSRTTQALFEARNKYETLVNDKSTLLGHLRELMRLLQFNSVEGVGQEANAGSGTYAAIINFNSYYTSLGKSQKDRIPGSSLSVEEPPKPPHTGLRAEIETLLNLSSNKEVNKNATQNLQTCIATRRKELAREVEQNQQELSEIGLKGETKAKLIMEAQREFETAQTGLKKELENKTYKEGKDDLPITQSLLNALQVKFAVNSLDDLRDLMAFSPSEIEAICQEEAVQKQVSALFPDLESLIVFMVETPPAKVQALFSATSKELAPKVFGFQSSNYTAQNGTTLYTWAIENHPEAVAPILAATKGLPQRKRISLLSTKLRNASQYHPAAVGPILDALGRLEVAEQAIILKEGRNPLLLAAQYQPTAVKPILEAMGKLAVAEQAYLLKQTGSNGYNSLLLAAQYQPTAVKPILEAMGKLSKAEQANLLKKTVGGHNSLMLAAQYQPAAVGPILEAMGRLEAAEQTNLLKQTVDGYNPLMFAAQYQPAAVGPILEAIGRLESAEQAKLLKHRSYGYSYNSLMLAVKHQPVAVGPILKAIKRLDASDQAYFLLQIMTLKEPEERQAIISGLNLGDNEFASLAKVKNSRWLPNIVAKEAKEDKQKAIHFTLTKFLFSLARDQGDDSKAQIQNNFRDLVKTANTHRSYLPFHIGNTKSCQDLIEKLSHAHPNEKTKLKEALDLELNEQQLQSPQAFKLALEKYVKEIDKKTVQEVRPMNSPSIPK